MSRHVIFNADDFGSSPGISRGIVEAHARGVVTSTSLMVDSAAAADAVELAAEEPGLALGLHWVEPGPLDTRDPNSLRAEIERQLGRFEELVGRPPTHVDSHHHVHREEHAMPVFRAAVEPLGVPLRGDGRVAFVGGFYAQWEWGVTELRYVSVPFLQWILREEAVAEWTEISCHPGYVEPEHPTSYRDERAVEVRTLTDPAVRATIDELGLRLASYADYAEAVAAGGAS